MDYYSDHDAGACAWLRELIADGLIPEGRVDERSIADIQPAELVGCRRVHLFAGIGGWPYALQLAGWPEDAEVWTGSCPCQPFSAAGKRKGHADERHLWPEMFRLIGECRPATVFGEQVVGAVGFGWLDGVFADLEAQGYACGAAVLGAHSVGAPHIRQRLFWVANAEEPRSGTAGQENTERRGRKREPGRAGFPMAVGMGDTGGTRPQERNGKRRVQRSAACPSEGQAAELRGDERTSGLGHAECELGGSGSDEPQRGPQGRVADRRTGPWTDSILIPCRDGKWRRVPGSEAGPEPSLFPLAHGLPGRVGLLRGAGNAIVPQAAALFVRAYLEAIAEGRWKA